jgi:hypothetical protein
VRAGVVARPAVPWASGVFHLDPDVVLADFGTKGQLTPPREGLSSTELVANSDAIRIALSARGQPPSNSASAARACLTWAGSAGRCRCSGACPLPRLSWSLSLPGPGVCVSQRVRRGLRWGRNRSGRPLTAGVRPPSRRDAERCRSGRDACGRVRRRAPLLPDPGGPVAKRPGPPGQCLPREEDVIADHRHNKTGRSPHQVAAVLRKTSSRCHSRNSRPGRAALCSGRSMTWPALA